MFLEYKYLIFDVTFSFLFPDWFAHALAKWQRAPDKIEFSLINSFDSLFSVVRKAVNSCFSSRNICYFCEDEWQCLRIKQHSIIISNICAENNRHEGD